MPGDNQPMRNSQTQKAINSKCPTFRVTWPGDGKASKGRSAPKTACQTSWQFAFRVDVKSEYHAEFFFRILIFLSCVYSIKRKHGTHPIQKTLSSEWTLSHEEETKYGIRVFRKPNMIIRQNEVVTQSISQPRRNVDRV